MGKLFSGIVAVIFVAAGLTALTIDGASGACPYAGCVDTSCHADNLNNPRAGHPLKVKFRVTTAGNPHPRGAVIFEYKRARNRAFVKEFTRRGYVGQAWQKYQLGTLPRGRYKVTAYFLTPHDSVFENCHKRFRQTVRAHR